MIGNLCFFFVIFYKFCNIICNIVEYSDLILVLYMKGEIGVLEIEIGSIFFMFMIFSIYYVWLCKFKLVCRFL